MNYKKIGFIVLLFMLIGELMIRFDEKFKLLEAKRVVKIATSLTITPEFTMLENNRINKLGNNFRIMVIGDSYIHGGGIDFKDNFSQQLKLILKTNNKKFDDIFVLDITKTSSNNLDNNQSYFEYADKYKPDIVIIGYNYNDVVGNLNKTNVQSKDDVFSKNNTSSEKQESITKKIYNIIYQSRFVHYVLSNLHTQLKSYGIVLPNSEFSLIMRSYPENKDNWVKSKILLQEIIDDSRKINSQLIVLKFPEINLLEYPQLFVETDKSIKDFFSKSPSVIYINSSEIFKGESSKDYILSKYDGHPNEKAHKKMAEKVYSLIKTIPDLQNAFAK